MFNGQSWFASVECVADESDRDIPMPLVSSGVENGNLRELALLRMRDFGLTCRDVRSREVGLHEIHNKVRVRPLLDRRIVSKKTDFVFRSRTNWS